MSRNTPTSKLGALTLSAFLSLGIAFTTPASGSDQAIESKAGSSAQPERNYGYSKHEYRDPKVTLVDVDGHAVDFVAAIDTPETVVIGFIFTTCQGVCPVITATMAAATRQLDQDGDDYKVYLVSLDPEYDTPTRLRDYAERFRTSDRISFLTGETSAVYEVLRSFNAIYLGGRKMNHQPVTLIRSRGDEAWVRLDGLVDARSLAEEVRRVRRDDTPLALSTATR
ncbi:MAG: SCO family protein [Xanthomonadaceae bacterium]|nr:SCO family protein [Xanthomonadaceae bacterium]